MRGPLAILLGVAGVVALVAVATTVVGGLGDSEPGCESSRPLRAAALADSLAPRYTRLPIGRKALDDIFKPLAKDLPADVAYEGQLLVRKRKPVAYVLVMNSSRDGLKAGEVYAGFAEPQGGQTRDVAFAGRTGRIRKVTGGFASVLAHGGCAAVTVGSQFEPSVIDVSRRVKLR